MLQMLCTERCKSVIICWTAEVVFVASKPTLRAWVVWRVTVGVRPEAR